MSGSGVSRGSPIDRLDGLVLAVLCGLKIAVGAWVLHRGFTHVSDDDYARTVIAEQFAHAPRLDPSGTSWLPFPFWIEGSAMAFAGRSLEVARAFAVVVGAACVAAPYLAMRAAGVTRAAAAIASGIAMALPWSAWLGVATVPEGWIGALTAAAAIGVGVDAARPWSVACLAAASLSRYEAWPACAVAALVCVTYAATAARASNKTPRARSAAAAREAAYALVAVLGPALWMAHNAVAHGSATHFLTRVSNFRHAIGAADIPLRDKLLGYPRSLLTDTPEAVALGVAGIAGVAASAVLRRRWAIPLATAVAILAFLVWGDVHDGAPTHHAARALVAVWWIGVGMGVDAASSAVAASGRAKAWAVAFACVAFATWMGCVAARWDDAPGLSDYDRRTTQIARGLDLRARDAAHVAIVPCSFEHFALLAAWGAPERADVKPRTGAAPTSDCPIVTER
jgi:hypothetical protein